MGSEKGEQMNLTLFFLPQANFAQALQAARVTDTTGHT
jgi:hypothetical protein